MTYLVVLEPSDDGGFGVYFPHLPGCISYGSNAEEAIKLSSNVAGLQSGCFLSKLTRRTP
ncbi:type II toxin-antitoxin system HicB family antitoxin [Lachnospiraceae bacterium MD1]|uniref:Type II toxin-antitoxin system HicB family antitoxin n=1 Tax=Variimorphobacter saccharofermentans TaxID=2755051 RepID=A0A839K0C9_9FIRM|nr:type II toxin-antitoxin system HicB family antitoxin [Variimorphobacter saccharofermentans]